MSSNPSPLISCLKHTKQRVSEWERDRERALSIKVQTIDWNCNPRFSYPLITMLYNFPRSILSAFHFCICFAFSTWKYHCLKEAYVRVEREKIINLWKISLNILLPSFWHPQQCIGKSNAQIWFHGNYKSAW